MRMETRVVDASVAVKWILDEPPLSSQAKNLYQLSKAGKYKLIVPELFDLELASAINKRIKKGMLSIRKAVDLQGLMMGFPFVEYSDRELSDVALENAYRYDVSVYDGVYLALAEIYGAPLITADQQLIKACKGKFDWIEYLGDFC